MIRVVLDPDGRPLRDRQGRKVYEYRHGLRRRGSRQELARFAAWVAARLSAAGADAAPAAHCRLDDALPKFLRYQKRKRRVAPATWSKAKRILSQFAADLGPNCDLAQISHHALERWQLRRAAQAKPGTVNAEIKTLKFFARWCIRNGLWLATEETVSWLRLELIHDRPRQPEPLSQPELETVMSILPHHVALPLWAMALTVDRPGALCALRAGDIVQPDLAHDRPGWLRLRQRKGGQLRTLSLWAGSLLEDVLAAAALIYLERHKRKWRPQDRVFNSNPVGKRPKPWTISGLDHAVAHHVAKAECQGLLPKPGRFTPYSIRHSLITWAAQQGASTYERQLLAGHKRETTCLVYTHLSGEAERVVREKMESIMGATMRQIIRKNGCTSKPESDKTPELMQLIYL